MHSSTGIKEFTSTTLSEDVELEFECEKEEYEEEPVADVCVESGPVDSGKEKSFARVLG